jgi:hypothetical protein
MSLTFIREVWDALRNHMDVSDRNDAADSLINLLIDNNYESEDIKDAFRSDKEILTALKDYIEDQEVEEDYEDFEEEIDTDEWD